jgi:hypothetical protein
MKNTTNFPKYNTVSSPTTSDLNLDNVKADYLNSGTTSAGLYRCVRSDLYALPTQTITNGNGSAPSTVSTVSSGTRSFWATNVAENGTYESLIASISNISGTQTSGAKYLCCNSLTAAQDVTKCNGSAYVNSAASNTSYGIDKRLVINWSKNNTAWKYGSAVVAGQIDINMNWNPDILMASLYHPAQPAASSTRTADGTLWCDENSTILNADKSEKVLITNNGFNGRTKCTYYMKAD